MPTSSRPRCRVTTRTNAADPGKRGHPCPSSIPALTTPMPAGRASRFRAGTEVRRKRHSRSSPIPRSGIVPAHRPRPSDGCWCETPTVSGTRRRSSAPTPRWIRQGSSPPSCGAGRSRSPYQELRAHLGLETQRQWSHAAIARTTPVLCGLYSLMRLWAGDLLSTNRLSYAAAWYQKNSVTFSDSIAAIRCQLWLGNNLSRSPPYREQKIIPPEQDKAYALRPLLRGVMHKVELSNWCFIPPVPVQNPWAHFRVPIEVMCAGWDTRLFQAWQQWSRMSS